MFRITYQVRTYLECVQMGWEEWQQAMKTAIPIVCEIRREYKAYLDTGDETHKQKADELKKTLPGACFQVSDYAVSVGTKKFNKGKSGRWREMLYAYLSGLVVIDVDQSHRYAGDNRYNRNIWRQRRPIAVSNQSVGEHCVPVQSCSA